MSIAVANIINNLLQTQTAILWIRLPYSQDVFHIDSSMYHDPKIVLWASYVCVSSMRLIVKIICEGIKFHFYTCYLLKP